MSGFILNGKTYEHVDLASIEVGDQIRVERWLRRADVSDARTWPQVIEIAREINRCDTLAEQTAHPEFKFSLSMTIYLARRAAGDEVTPEDCLKWKATDIVWLNDDGTSTGDAEDDDQGKDQAL